MQGDYSIEEILWQSASSIAYRVTDQNGQQCVLTRLVVADEILRKIDSKRFLVAIAELKQLEHPCLRRVLDGGQDEVDGFPWMVTQWWEGDTLEDRVANGRFESHDRERLEGQARLLIGFLGDRAGVLSFHRREIISTAAADGSLVETFTIDFAYWLRTSFIGETSGLIRNPELGLARLLPSLTGQRAAPEATRPLSTSPAQMSPLASAESKMKALPIVAVLIVFIGGGAWWAMNRSDEPPQLAIEETEETEDPLRPPTSSRKDSDQRPSAQALKGVIAQEVAEDSKPELPMAERPSAGEMKEVSAADEDALKKHAGQWVIMQGRVKVVSEQGEWVFEKGEKSEDPLKARLTEGKVEGVEGKVVSVIGRLQSPYFLEIPSPDDVEILDDIDVLPEKELYTLEDEAQVRTLEGQTISFRAKVLSVTTSSSKSTLYLNFTKKAPVLAAGVRVLRAEDGITLEYLKGLEGKEITVTGQAGEEYGGHRFLISFTRKDQIQE